MIYIRNIFKQDLRDGKQIAFTKEPSNIFFKFNYNTPDPYRQITFEFKVQNPKSPFISKSGIKITTRLYANPDTESRIDGELKQFLRNDLKANIDDIIVFKYKKEDFFEFDFIPKSFDTYKSFKDILKHGNHEIIINDIAKKADSSEDFIPNLTNLKKQFIEWFIKKDGISHNYFSGQFSSSRERLLSELEKAEEVYQQEFDSKIFEINEINLESFIKELEDNLSLKEGMFYEYSAGKSNHRPRAIIGNKNYIKFLNEKLEEEKTSNSQSQIANSYIEQFKFEISTFQQACQTANLSYNPELITRYIASLTTKPFVLLSGLSGSGKTKLAQAFAQWIAEDKTQYCIVPVGADWTNREPLLGYVNALNDDEYILPENGALKLLIEANKEENKNKPYFLILDEMNLSHVERYFADFLSVMESKDILKLHSSENNKNNVPSQLDWPSNLFIVGTVNIDETTYMFSPKVLDRANVIEFRVNRDDIAAFLKAPNDIDFSKLNNKGAAMGEDFISIASNKDFLKTDTTELNKNLVLFFKELKKTGAEFGYRSATEIHRLYNQLTTLDNTMHEDTKIDIAIMQKLLPKLHGSRRKLCPILEVLASLCVEEKTDVSKDFLNNKETIVFKGNEKVLYPLSLEKITRMYKGALDNGFASYAEA
ncbi:McrB family protein [Winogradskyella sp. Asnod2-B02-A]|uniref:McrB family protein n=1 Tax=Winogradskyella sp. Asnod2-B02-A TaxID=3160583 RepID=UPI0038698C23